MRPRASSFCRQLQALCYISRHPPEQDVAVQRADVAELSNAPSAALSTPPSYVFSDVSYFAVLSSAEVSVGFVSSKKSHM
mmetsp:Transcript_15527/g.34780  ORF Transcript_15527/g.34780 Transcript_15527/m.34780 type:complete len:80 (+) Transcript_15527:956-1195(+)